MLRLAPGSDGYRRGPEGVITRLAMSPLLALAIAVVVCWFVGGGVLDVRPRPDAGLPAPGIPAELLGFHGAGTPCRPEDAPWIVQATPGEANECMDGERTDRRSVCARGVFGPGLASASMSVSPSRRPRSLP